MKATLSLLLFILCACSDDGDPVVDAGGSDALLDAAGDLVRDMHATDLGPSPCPGRPWQRPDPNGFCAAYEVQVVLPPCKVVDPAVQLIQSSEDWESLNEPKKRVFCVMPGNFQGLGRFDLTESGTATAPRVIRSYVDPMGSGKDIHPATQSESQRAVVAGFRFQKAHRWIIHGLTLRPSGTGHMTPLFIEEGDHNVIDGVLVEKGGGGGGQIQLRGQGNVLQNSVLRDTALDPKEDMHCVRVAGDARDFRIVNNEIYNCGGDAIQVLAGQVSGLSVIENNDLYITADLYTDCAGTRTPKGDCACAENALDLKNGGKSGEPLLVERNRAWGFRKTDTACSGTGSGGEAAVIHMDAQYILVRANVLCDAPGGIHTPNPAPHHVSLVGNVIAQMTGGAAGIGQLSKASYIDAYYNTLVDAGDVSSGTTHDESCNIIAPGSSNNTQLCIKVRRWTSPQKVCLPHGKLEQASLSASCQTGTGQTKSVGIDDRIWTPADAVIE